MPRSGRSQERSSDQMPSMMLTSQKPPPSSSRRRPRTWRISQPVDQRQIGLAVPAPPPAPDRLNRAPQPASAFPVADPVGGQQDDPGAQRQDRQIPPARFMRRPKCRSVFGRYSMARPTASTPNQKLFGSSISKM